MEIRRLILAWMLGIMMLIFANSTLQGNVEEEFVYHDPIRHFSISLPKGWKRIPQKVLLAKRDEIVQSMPSSSDVMYNLIVGFHVKDKEYFQSPYIYIYYDEAELSSFEEIAGEHSDSEMNRVLGDVEKESKNIFKNAKSESVFIDEKKKRIYWTFQMEVVGIGNIKSLGAICIGNDRYTLIYGYSEAVEFERMLPTFQSIIAAFTFDPGYTYDDKQQMEGGYFQKITDSALISFLVSGIVVFLIAYFRKKRGDKLRTKRELSEMDTQK